MSFRTRRSVEPWTISFASSSVADTPNSHVNYPYGTLPPSLKARGTARHLAVAQRTSPRSNLLPIMYVPAFQRTNERTLNA